MIWLYIYLGISVITLLLLYLTTIEAAYEFKRRYPNIKVPKHAFIEKVASVFRITLTCFFPIINIAMLWRYLFDKEAVMEKAIASVYLKHSREKEKEDG